MSVRVGVCMLLLLLNWKAYAQHYIVHVEKYDLESGLSNRQVNTICKDKRGMLWIGTQYGLNSYDGYNFEFYTREKNGLPFNEISKIVEDDAGNLLLFGASATKNIASFNPVTHQVKLLGDKYPVFCKYNFLETITDSNNVLYMTVPDIDTIWVYSAKRGLCAKQVTGISPFGILDIHNGSIYLLSKDSILLRMDTTFKILDRWLLPFKSKYYVNGPKNKGLLIRENYNFSSNRAEYLAFPDSICMLHINDLPPRNEKLVDFFFDPEIDGIMWRQGKLFDKEKELIIDFAEQGYKDLQHIPRVIFQDASNEMWVGSDFGLYKITINRNKFRNYFNTVAFNQDNRNSYRGIYINNGKLLANNESGGICVFNLKSNLPEVTTKPGDFGGFTFLVPDSNGNLLQGCFSGINKINAAHQTKTIRISDRDVRAWALQPLGNDIFLAGTETGLYYYNNRQGSFIPFQKYNSFGQLSTAFVLSITPDKFKENNFWLCTNKGLYELNIDKGIIAAHFQNMYDVFFIYQDNNNFIWLGTNQGLLKWDSKKDSTDLYTRADGLSDNTIYSIAADRSGCLWLGSNYGLMRFDKATLQVKTYLVEDGVSNNEFNRISYYTDGTHLFFGTLNGITSFISADFDADTSVIQPPFVITAYSRFDHSTDKMQDYTGELLDNYNITIHTNDKLFTLEYALLNYNYTAQNLYAYKIDGVNDDWIYSKEHALSFSSLPYGHHTLHIKGKGLNTTWSKEIDIDINVLKPFYLQLWFFVFLVVAVALLFYAYVAFRTYNFMREQQRLEQEVSRKTATIMQQSEALKLSLHQKEILLKEIHHRVKNNLQVISGLLSLQGSSSDNAEVQTIMHEGRNRIKSMSLIHQMLYQNEDLQKLNFKEYLQQLMNNILAGSASSKNIGIKIQAEDIWFDIDTAIPLGLIVTELATNAIKHAFTEAGGQIKISVEQLDTENYRLIFSDSGKGLPPGFDIDNAKSLGLKLVRMLGIQIAAEVTFENDNGTYVTLSFSDKWKNKG